MKNFRANLDISEHIHLFRLEGRFDTENLIVAPSERAAHALLYNRAMEKAKTKKAKLEAEEYLEAKLEEIDLDDFGIADRSTACAHCSAEY